MSGEDERFLGRWSRRKQEAQEGEKQQQEVAALPPEQNLSAEETGIKKEEPEFDVSTLPPIESIVAGTDIRAFLSKGVPAALTQAALRRAWSADPAIRDYIGLSENSWDFNALDGQHGFAPLSSNTDIKGMLSDIFGEVREGAEKLEKLADAATPENPRVEAPENPLRVSGPKQETEVVESPQDDLRISAEQAEGDKNAHSEVAAQKPDERKDDFDALPTRRHGSALPT